MYSNIGRAYFLVEPVISLNSESSNFLFPSKCFRTLFLASSNVRTWITISSFSLITVSPNSESRTSLATLLPFVSSFIVGGVNVLSRRVFSIRFFSCICLSSYFTEKSKIETKFPSIFKTLFTERSSTIAANSFWFILNFEISSALDIPFFSLNLL